MFHFYEQRKQVITSDRTFRIESVLTLSSGMNFNVLSITDQVVEIRSDKKLIENKTYILPVSIFLLFITAIFVIGSYKYSELICFCHKIRVVQSNLKISS